MDKALSSCEALHRIANGLSLNSVDYPIMDGISRGVIYVIGKSKGFETLQELGGFKHLAKYDVDYAEYRELVDALIGLI